MYTIVLYLQNTIVLKALTIMAATCHVLHLNVHHLDLDVHDHPVMIMADFAERLLKLLGLILLELLLAAGVVDEAGSGVIMASVVGVSQEGL